MRIRIPVKEVKRNAFLRIHGSNVPDWPTFHNKIYGIFGVPTTEDNTVGQLAQEKHITESGTAEGSVNLWGRNIKPIKERVLAAIAKGEAEEE